MKNINLKIIIFSAIFLLIPCFVFASDSFPAFPMAFYGEANLNGEPLPAGTKIQAYSNDILKGEVEMLENKFYGYASSTKIKLLVSEFEAGDLIFKYIKPGSIDPIAGDAPVKYIEPFEQGKIVEKKLDFSKEIQPTPSTPVSSGGGGGGGGAIDRTPPDQPTNLKISRSSSSIEISWDNPNNYDFNKIILVRSISSLATNISASELDKEGELIYEGNEELYLDENIEANITYYYAISAYDNRKNYSQPLVIISAPEDNKKSSEDSTEEAENNEIEVLGIEYSDYSNLKNLANIDSEIVEAISLAEAELLYNVNQFIEMDENILEIYNKIIGDYSITLPDETKFSIAYYIQFGTQVTKYLGAGERAGALNSYVSAFGVFPQSIAEWQDVIKIANGRWPNKKSEEAENRAKNIFADIYLRNPNMNNANDNAAVTVIAYGLRPANRNMDSEKSAINIFKDIFGYKPSSATDWDAVRAIAYSGAKR